MNILEDNYINDYVKRIERIGHKRVSTDLGFYSEDRIGFVLNRGNKMIDPILVIGDDDIKEPFVDNLKDLKKCLDLKNMSSSDNMMESSSCKRKHCNDDLDIANFQIAEFLERLETQKRLDFKTVSGKIDKSFVEDVMLPLDPYDPQYFRIFDSKIMTILNIKYEKEIHDKIIEELHLLQNKMFCYSLFDLFGLKNKQGRTINYDLLIDDLIRTDHKKVYKDFLFNKYHFGSMYDKDDKGKWELFDEKLRNLERDKYIDSDVIESLIDRKKMPQKIKNKEKGAVVIEPSFDFPQDFDFSLEFPWPSNPYRK